MDHQIIARMARHRHCRPRRPSGRIDRPHIWQHRASAALRLMYGRDAQFTQLLNGLDVGSRDAADNLMGHTYNPSGEFAGYLWIDALIRLGVLDSLFSGIPNRLRAAALGQVAIVIPQVL